MMAHVLRRVLSALALVVVLAGLAAFVVELAPGGLVSDPGFPGAERPDIDALDGPTRLQVVRRLGRILLLDPGLSHVDGSPIRPQLLEALPISIWVLSPGLLISGLVGGLLGFRGVQEPGSRWLDRAGWLCASVPGFLVATLLALLAQTTGLLPTVGLHHPDPTSLTFFAWILDSLKHLLLPAAVLACAGIPRVVGATQAASHARGLSGMSGGHAIWFVVGQLLKLVVPMLGVLVFVEYIFTIDGVGSLLFRAVLSRDLPVVAGGTVLISMIAIISWCLADLLALVRQWPHAPASGQGPWRSDRLTTALAVGLLAIAAGSSVLASDQPVVARHGEALCFPAVADTWEVWRPGVVEAPPQAVPSQDVEEPRCSPARGWEDEEAVSWALWPPISWPPERPDFAAIAGSSGEAGGHLLGVDSRGRDVLSRLLHGATVALKVGLLSQLVAGGLGLIFGLAAALRRGLVSRILTGIVESLRGLPLIVLLLAAVAFIEPTLASISILLGLAGWPRVFRVTRAAAEPAGAAPPKEVSLSRVREALRRALVVLPRALAQGAAVAVAAESGLSFLGMGDPAAASWGEAIRGGRALAGSGTWLPVFASALILVVTLGVLRKLGEDA